MNNKNYFRVRHPILMLSVFIGAYFTTITVNAQTAAAPSHELAQMDNKNNVPASAFWAP